MNKTKQKVTPFRITPMSLTKPFLPMKADIIPKSGNRTIKKIKNSPEVPKKIVFIIIKGIKKQANKNTNENKLYIFFIISLSLFNF
jgi:hypothetical protein